MKQMKMFGSAQVYTSWKHTGILSYYVEVIVFTVLFLFAVISV